MNWTNTQPDIKPRVKLETPDCFDLSLNHHNGCVWQFFAFHFGKFTDVPIEKARQTWPREAIAEARKRLDDLESRLGPPSLDEIREQWVARIENASTQGELNQIADEIESVEGFLSYDHHFLDEKIQRRSLELAEGINPAW